jgi:serine/threonine-protein kinase
VFERIKDLLGGGIAGRYEIDAPCVKHTLYTISNARDKKTFRAVLVKTYTDEGMDIENRLDEKYRDKPLAEILPGLSNRFVVKTIETGVIKGRRVEILEALPTTTLRELIAQRKLSAKGLRRAILQVGEAIVYLHSLGYLHRGLSPDAISVTPEGDARIMDLSFLMDVEMTRTGGTVVGPNGYVAPEIIRRGQVDERSDIWSFGAVIYEALSGSKPFTNGHGYEALVKIINTKPMPLSERCPGTPEDLEGVIMKALGRYPEERYASVEEMMIEFTLAHMPEKAQRRPAVAAA